MSEEKEDLPPSQLKYQQWLQSKHVHVASDLVTTTNDTNLVVAGWGCVANSDIEKGMVLFSIPRAACFGAAAAADDADNDDDDDPTTQDTQMDMAIAILRCQQQNNNNDTKDEQDWSPFLNLLTPPPHGLPWMWSPEFRQALLRGTELERVVENKAKRIRMEYEQIVKQQQHQRSSFTYQEYVNACAIVSSHTNPWFGVSIVPFNTTLNWCKMPNVEFDLEEDVPYENTVACQRIVGRASCNIKKGQELFQAYGTSGASDSVADFVYRYGFAPSTLEECSGMDGDVVSIDVADILSIAEATKKQCKNHSRLNSETLNLNTRRQVGSDGSDIPFSSVTNITQLSSRLEALKMSGALDESPWDGMRHWTAEIGRPAVSFLQTFCASSQSKSRTKRDRENENFPVSLEVEDRLAFDDGGLSKLVGIFIVLLADDADWERASIALQNFENDHKGSSSSGNEADSCDSEAKDDESSQASDESRKDDITASILLSSIFNLCPHQREKLLQVALHVGMGGNDPWRALLDGVANAIATANSDIEQKLKKGKTAEQQQQQDEKKEDISNTICMGTTTLTSTSSYVQKVKAAFEAANAAICLRRRKLIEGELSFKNIFTDLVTQQAKNGQGSDDVTSLAKEEAIKTVEILRHVEKSILEQAIKILEMATFDDR